MDIEHNNIQSVVILYLFTENKLSVKRCKFIYASFIHAINYGNRAFLTALKRPMHLCISLSRHSIFI